MARKRIKEITWSEEDFEVLRGRFFEKHRVLNNKCWEWLGVKNTTYGYGTIFFKKHSVSAHRLSLYLFKGVAFGGELHADHLCRNRWCVNPSHLEMVTPRENTLRGLKAANYKKPWKQKTHCLRGHELTKENTYVVKNRRSARHCRACLSIRMKAYYLRKHKVTSIKRGANE